MTEKPKEAAPEINNHEEKGNGNTCMYFYCEKTTAKIENTRRARILTALRTGKKTARQLAKLLNMTAHEAARILHEMRREGVVTSEPTDTHSRLHEWKLTAGIKKRGDE